MADGDGVRWLKVMEKNKAGGKAESGSKQKRLSSVGTAIQLLKAFSEEQVDIGISDLSRRLAATLVAEGLLEQDRESGKYRLGIALFRLGALVRRRMDISSQGRPYIY